MKERLAQKRKDEERIVDIGNRVQCCVFHNVSHRDKIIALAGASKSIIQRKKGDISCWEREENLKSSKY
jgi:hypothetical protein